MPEIRTISETGGEKGMKEERYDLIPVEALAEVARLYGKGAQKYSAHNWRKGYEWSKSYAALQRHATQFWNGEDIDEEMGLPHLTGVIFHALTLITFMKEQPGFDDRFKTKPKEKGMAEVVDEQMRNRGVAQIVCPECREVLWANDEVVEIKGSIYHSKCANDKARREGWAEPGIEL